MIVEKFLYLLNGTSFSLDQVEDKSRQETTLIFEGQDDSGIRFERRARETGVQFRDEFWVTIVVDTAKSIELLVRDRFGSVRIGVGNDELETNLSFEVIEGLQDLGIEAQE
ncbi:MAG: hypothetical protein GY832_05670 [Chloroflexi bacterium]|nr:hypothetical protein [Chloroflexota bacterium]